jgi:hypothetical protein
MMELNEQPFAPTLAQELGDVPHVSGLLRRIAQISGAGGPVTGLAIFKPGRKPKLARHP